MPALPNSLRKLLTGLFQRLGYGLYRLDPELNAGLPYEGVQTIASYAPWNTDEAFRRVYAQVRGYTLVDRYRLYELWSLVEQVSKLSGALLEVGVWRGGSGVLMAARLRSLGAADPVYLCDTFSGVVKASPKDSLYRGGEHADTSKAIVEGLLKSLALENVHVLQGIFPDETASLIPAGPLRLVHIDVDTYQSARDILDWAWPPLVSGGVVVFDDYGFKGCDGITRCVNEQRLLPDRHMLHNLNGHAIFIKLA